MSYQVSTRLLLESSPIQDIETFANVRAVRADGIEQKPMTSYERRQGKIQYLATDIRIA